jgi:hypothetical protein
MSAGRPGRTLDHGKTRRDLRLRGRKPLLAAHVLVSATWLGAVIANLFMGISAAATKSEEQTDAYYAVMDPLVNTLMPAAAIATLATGLLLAVTTKSGLLSHHWVMAKFVLRRCPRGIPHRPQRRADARCLDRLRRSGPRPLARSGARDRTPAT